MTEAWKRPDGMENNSKTGEQGRQGRRQWHGMAGLEGWRGGLGRKEKEEKMPKGEEYTYQIYVSRPLFCLPLLFSFHLLSQALMSHVGGMSCAPLPACL